MKTRIAISIVFVLQVSFALAQDQTQTPTQKLSGNIWKLDIRSSDSTGFPLRHTEPLFVVNSDDRTLMIMPVSTSGLRFNHSFPSDLQSINPDLINSIRVYQTQEAVDRFGQSAKNGAVIIELKDGSLERLPAHLADRFTVKN